jgi:hypothetical protein
MNFYAWQCINVQSQTSCQRLQTKTNILTLMKPSDNYVKIYKDFAFIVAYHDYDIW